MISVTDEDRIVNELNNRNGLFSSTPARLDGINYDSLIDKVIENNNTLNGIEELPRYDSNLFNGISINGESEMVTPIPPWGVVVLEGPSIEKARSRFFRARSKGATLFHLPFDSFSPKGTPESRARFGVQIVQIAALLKGHSIASIRPESYGGKVPESILPESYRLDHLRMIASQGFSWVEIEQTIQKNDLDQLISIARKASSKILITCYLDEMKEWTPPENIDPNMIDGYRIIVAQNDSRGLKRACRAALNARNWAWRKKIMVEPRHGSNSISRVFGPLSLSDMVNVEFEEIVPQSSASGLDHPELNGIWESMGLLGEGIGKEWSLYGRKITPESKIYLQLGRISGSEYRSKIFNSQFNQLSLDGLMVPWPNNGNSIQECLDNSRKMGINGAYIEMPLRTSAVQHMNWVDPRSMVVGSINLVKFNEGKANGYNSEIYGISDEIALNKIPRSSKTIILGTGAGGRAAAIAASMMGMDTYIAGNNKERTVAIADKLQSNIKGTSFKSLAKPSIKFDFIINSVPFESRSVKGSSDQMMEIAEIVKKFDSAYGMDLFPETRWTPFLSSIESRGGTPISGVDVLASTFKRSFKLMTGHEPVMEHLTKVIEDTLL